MEITGSELAMNTEFMNEQNLQLKFRSTNEPCSWPTLDGFLNLV